MKINVILKKEDIVSKDIKEHHHVVVLDILLATSTIVSILKNGAEAVYPVVSKEDALQVKESLGESYLFVGENKGKNIKGFMPPSPLLLQSKVHGKNIILLTTNGTVAINRVKNSKKVYIASLLNGRAIAEEMMEDSEVEKIHIICSGSNNQFCIEDFYGAGYLIDEIKKQSKGMRLELSDSSRAAFLLFNNSSSESAGEDLLHQSTVGKMLTKQNYIEEIKYVNQRNKYSFVPKLKDNRIVLL